MLIKDGMTVLFQGDSITDWGRNERPDSLGNGYAMMAAGLFTLRNPHIRANFLNRGISSNRVENLVERWDTDCIELKPDVVSVLIGINDVSRNYNHDDPISAEDFKSFYAKILERTTKELGAKLVICEPYLLPYPEDRQIWRGDLDPKIHATRALAREFGAAYVPLDGLFAAAAVARPSEVWSPDGVHPTAAGHALIAEAWLDAVSKA